VEQKGIDVWFELDPQELLGASAGEYDKVSDTLDVWFDSGVSHACVLDKRAELQYPADLYLEGSDQHRGWFQSSLLSAVATRGSAPYKMALTHGFTVDDKGRKMSKSLGNTILPQKVISSLGADILRLWVASTDYRNEMSVSDEILTRMSDSYRRIRNTARYLLGNLAGFDPAQQQLPREKMLALDVWAMLATDELDRQIRAAYEDFSFHLVYQKLHQFCVIELGSFYLDVLKDRVYTTKPDSAARRSAQTAMQHILEALVRWMAPVLSFTAEEIWKSMPGERAASVFLSTWQSAPPGADQTGVRSLAYWGKVLKVREQVGRELEQARVAGVIGASLDAEVDLYCDPAQKALLDTLQDELRFVCITSYARVHDLTAAPADCVDTALPGLRLKVTPSAHAKCIRCWHHRADVGADKEHVQLCGRCVTNVTGAGESRSFA
jgi:isoleucyl-tRNA synthetase